MYQMSQKELILNKVAQGKIDFNLGIQLLSEDFGYDFDGLFMTLKNYIFNAIPEKTYYNTETYQKSINTIPLKSTYSPIVILKRFPIQIAFSKLAELPQNENIKVITALLWIFKVIDTQRRNTECKNGCGHFWHSLE